MKFFFVDLLLSIPHYAQTGHSSLLQVCLITNGCIALLPAFSTHNSKLALCVVWLKVKRIHIGWDEKLRLRWQCIRHRAIRIVSFQLDICFLNNNFVLCQLQNRKQYLTREQGSFVLMLLSFYVSYPLVFARTCVFLAVSKTFHFMPRHVMSDVNK